jgi:nitrite reductase (NADH) large subunit
MSRRLVIVGYGMVAHRLVEHLRELDRTADWSVVVLAEEKCPAYDRVALSSCLDGAGRDDLTLPAAGPAGALRVDLRLGCPAVAVDPGARVVYSATGDALRYDALVLATGARPFVPPVPGHDLTGCFAYRTVDDVDAIRAHATRGRPAVVVGGGLLGLEAANGLRLRGMTPFVVESAPHLMAAQLDAGAGQVLRELATGLGLRVHCPASLASVEAGTDGSVAGVRLEDRTVLPADLVVFAAGVRARDELAETGGWERGDRGGFLTDDFCRTSAADVWAIGDCAAVHGRCHGLIATGYRMAESVARQLAGLPAERFDATGDAINLKLAGIQVATVGRAVADVTTIEVAFADNAHRYAKVVLDRETSGVLGGVLVGDTASPGALRNLLGKVVPAGMEQILLPALAPGLSGTRLDPGGIATATRGSSRPACG